MLIYQFENQSLAISFAILLTGNYLSGNYLSVLMYTRPVFRNSANNLNVKKFRIEMDFKKY